MKTIIAFAVALLGISAAHAADLPTSLKDRFDNRPAIAQQVTDISPAPVWSGFFVGGSLNFDRLDTENSGGVDWSDCDHCTRRYLDEYFDTKGAIASRLPDLDDTGISGGVRAGYLFQAGRVYGGPVLMADFGKVEAELNHSFDDDVRGKLSIGSSWRAAGVVKGGVIVTDWLGVYGFAGVGLVDVDVNASLSDGDETVSIMNYRDTVTALTFGAGADLKLSQNVAAFAEWQRFDLDSFDGSKTVDCFRFVHHGNADLDVIRVGLTYTFN